MFVCEVDANLGHLLPAGLFRLKFGDASMANQLSDFFGQRICNHVIASRTKVHPANQNIPVLIEHLHNIYKGHTVGDCPILQTRCQDSVCQKGEFDLHNSVFFFQFVFHHFGFLCIGDTFHINILDHVGLRLLLESHKNDSSSLTFPINRVDIANEVFARACNVLFNFLAVKSGLSNHILQQTVRKGNRDEVVACNAIGNFQGIE